MDKPFMENQARHVHLFLWHQTLLPLRRLDQPPSYELLRLQSSSFRQTHRRRQVVQTSTLTLPATSGFASTFPPQTAMITPLTFPLSSISMAEALPGNTPEHRYPSQVKDGFDVLSFIENNTNFEGFPKLVNLNNCFIAGDSAGGNLAHHVAVKACESEFKNLKIIGVIAIQPFFGGQERTEAETRLVGAPFINVQGTDGLWRMFLPEGADRDHPAANIFGPKSEDISGLKFPATIVIVGGFDPLQDWQKRYYEGLKKAGKEAYLIEYPNAFHAFYSVPELEEASLFIDEVREFMKKECAKRFD
ncbi:hypothetical protein Pint_07183 [Pistacia integerrima]|uniref:Uncharacterized protein n=1 Tax=Pistacia integerrima TaxID=434235 RepID=A0ACC0XRH2_9ROSI|nr:hypothetical protein Pint_07183 [Pistacia integerrima]